MAASCACQCSAAPGACPACCTDRGQRGRGASRALLGTLLPRLRLPQLAVVLKYAQGTDARNPATGVTTPQGGHHHALPHSRRLPTLRRTACCLHHRSDKDQGGCDDTGAGHGCAVWYRCNGRSNKGVCQRWRATAMEVTRGLRGLASQSQEWPMTVIAGRYHLCCSERRNESTRS